LILTVTRQCNLRCSYCPTAKDGWPSLTVAQTDRALELFAQSGGGDLKLFGGEPLLVPELVAHVVERASAMDAVRRIYLSTNGLNLSPAWLQRVRETPKLILTLSLDGRPADNRRFRRALPGVPDAYERITQLLPLLRKTPRLVVTMTIAPAAAKHMAENFDHLLELGFHRFNFLPGYYIPWRPEQLVALRAGFEHISARVQERWARGQSTYVRNLFTWAPTPFFNTGLIVDSDGTIQPSNVGLSGALDDLRAQTRVGTLDDPPTPEALKRAADQVNGLLAGALSQDVLDATAAADAELTRFVRGLIPAWRKKRQAK
jgi:sulfatase maturation enzyme AslB (radical SAM superfamily)